MVQNIRKSDSNVEQLHIAEKEIIRARWIIRLVKYRTVPA